MATGLAAGSCIARSGLNSTRLVGVAAALERLQQDGRKLVVLSNTSKRRGPLIAELPGRGFRSEWLRDAICSGECCWEALRDSGYASAVVLGWSDRDSSEYLAGTGVALADTAPDVVIAYGPDTIDMAGRTLTDFRMTGDMAPYRDLLEVAVARGAPDRLRDLLPDHPERLIW